MLFRFKGERFDAHNDITNRRLLWHGTNVAVVVAILKSGLRIMPHSGGRVGRGIYFASENGKSSCYGMLLIDGWAMFYGMYIVHRYVITMPLLSYIGFVLLLRRR